MRKKCLRGALSSAFFFSPCFQCLRFLSSFLLCAFSPSLIRRLPHAFYICARRARAVFFACMRGAAFARRPGGALTSSISPFATSHGIVCAFTPIPTAYGRGTPQPVLPSSHARPTPPPPPSCPPTTISRNYTTQRIIGMAGG